MPALFGRPYTAYRTESDYRIRERLDSFIIHDHFNKRKERRKEKTTPATRAVKQDDVYHYDVYH